MSIRIQGIKKGFGDQSVLRGIDFAFKAGAVNMIIGASGSGKTVLTKCMVGLMRPDQGQIWYEEQALNAASPQVLRHIRMQIGMLFQSAALFDSLSVAENIAFPLRLQHQIPQAEINDKVQVALEKVRLPDAGNKRVSELSGGMKKRVGIARAIAANPTYLFCDEPNSGLDPPTAGVIDELIEQITEEYQTTTVVVTHDMKSVLSTADNILFLFEGEKAWEGRPEEIPHADNTRLQDYIASSGLDAAKLLAAKAR